LRGRESFLRHCAAASIAGGALLLLVPAGGADQGRGINSLRSRQTSLAERSHAALLDLYAFDSQLSRARAEAAGLRAQAASLSSGEAVARVELRAAKHTLELSQRLLGDELRALYEQEQPDPVAVVLGATSLSEAVNGIDELGRAAAATKNVIEQTRAARRRVEALRRSLDARSAEVARLERAAAEREAALVSARAEREGYLARLRSEQRLTAEQISALDARARAAEATAHALTVQAQTVGSTTSFGASAAVSPPPTPPSTAPDTGESDTGKRQLAVSSTGYCLTGTTATGLPVAPGIVAVDPTVIPLGTRMYVPGYGPGVAADVGSAVRGLDIDLWMASCAQAGAYGRQTVTITLY
jgi:peptidoglycan DL-endopeptidase CwlO